MVARFAFGVVGLTARSNFGQGAPLVMTQTQIDHRLTGLRTWGKGAHLTGCTFTGNLHSWEMYGATFNSTFTSSTTHTNTGLGVSYTG
ncbi:MAG: hypothetical protein OHK0039_46670 [Bacteroidia bacterium]